MPNIGIPEMIIVLVIALVILGPKKLPDAGRSLGAGMRIVQRRHHRRRQRRVRRAGDTPGPRGGLT